MGYTCDISQKILFFITTALGTKNPAKASEFSLDVHFSSSQRVT
jgi:hypothetical protein